MPDISEVFLYLIGCSVNGRKPAEEILADIDWEKLYKLAKRHSLTSVVEYAVEKTAAFEQAASEIRKAWREDKEKAIRRILIFDVERAALFSEFEKQGIWYMPLKGIVMKDYYPRIGMREMGDNDILFDPDKRAEVRAIFEDRGYSVKSYNHSNHDTYEKAAGQCFEMHVMLFDPWFYPQLSAYYDQVKEMLIKDDGKAFGYHLSNEDFYVFMIAHAYKHYSQAGTGLRTLTDMYLLNQRLGKTLDRAVVDRALSSLGLADYEQKSTALAERLFSHPSLLSDISLSEAERKELNCYLYTSTYGTYERKVSNGLNNTGGSTFRAKVRYLVHRLFRGRSWWRVHYPVADRYPVLLPFFWVWWLLLKVKKRIPKLKKEYKALKKAQ